jgi:myosin heavy subunit
MSDSVYQRLNIREVNDQRPLSPSVGMSRRASAPSAMLDSTVSSYGNSAKIERYRKWKGDAGGGAATTMDSLSTSTIGRNNMMLRSQVEDMEKHILLLKENEAIQNAQVKRLTEVNSKLVAEIETNRQDLHRMATLKEGVSRLIEKHEELRAELKQTKEKLQENRASKDFLETENGKLKSAMKEMTDALQENMNRLNEYKRENGTLRESQAALEELAEELKQTARRNLQTAMEGKVEKERDEQKLKKAKKAIQALSHLSSKLLTRLRNEGIDFFSEQEETHMRLSSPPLSETTPSVSSDDDQASVQTTGSSHVTYDTATLDMMESDQQSAIVDMLQTHVDNMKSSNLELEDFRRRGSTISGSPKLSSPTLMGEDQIKKEIKTLEQLLKHAESVEYTSEEDMKEYKALIEHHAKRLGPDMENYVPLKSLHEL